VATRLDTDEKDLQVEGSIANILPLRQVTPWPMMLSRPWRYGYIREYEVEKIKGISRSAVYMKAQRDPETVISMFRLQATVRSKGNSIKVLLTKSQCFRRIPAALYWQMP
jgi:predicted DNA-binding transcriptional regulator AlpA